MFLRLIDIGDCGAAGGEHGTADEASDEAEGEEHTGVGGVDDGKLKEDKGEEGADIDRVAAYIRDLGHWRLWRRKRISMKRGTGILLAEEDR